MQRKGHSVLPPVVLFGLLAASIGLTMCSTELGPPPPGQSIVGEVTFVGVDELELEHPTLLVVATLSLTEDAPAYALAFIEAPDFSQPVSYELKYLLPYDYLVVAQVTDGTLPEMSSIAGSYPNSCVLLSPPTPPPVVVGEDAPTTGVNFTVYADVLDDPCFSQGPDYSVDRCPAEDAATVALTLVFDGDAPVAGDMLVVAALDDWDSSGGELSVSVEPLVTPATGVEFPLEVGLNAVPAGDYYIYACLDRGGDNTTTACGNDDDWAILDSEQPTTIEAGRVTNISLDLTDGSGELTSVDEPGEECIAALSNVVVRVSSTTITPESGDLLGAALFAGSPAPPPDYAASVEPTGFPVDVVVEDVPEGDYYLVVCFDKYGDESANCAGEGDVLYMYDNLASKLTVEGAEVLVEVDM